MYKIPDDITNSFLKGETVKMICFNISQIYIHFESMVQVTIEGQYILSKGSDNELFDVYPISSDNGILELLEKKVRYISISDSRQDLSIYFDDNLSIKLLGSDNYESYTLTINGRRIII